MPRTLSRISMHSLTSNNSSKLARQHKPETCRYRTTLSQILLLLSLPKQITLREKPLLLKMPAARTGGACHTCAQLAFKQPHTSPMHHPMQEVAFYMPLLPCLPPLSLILHLILIMILPMMPQLFLVFQQLHL